MRCSHNFVPVANLIQLLRKQKRCGFQQRMTKNEGPKRNDIRGGHKHKRRGRIEGKVKEKITTVKAYSYIHSNIYIFCQQHVTFNKSV